MHFADNHWAIGCPTPAPYAGDLGEVLPQALHHHEGAHRRRGQRRAEVLQRRLEDLPEPGGSPGGFHGGRQGSQRPKWRKSITVNLHRVTRQSVQKRRTRVKVWLFLRATTFRNSSERHQQHPCVERRKQKDRRNLLLNSLPDPWAMRNSLPSGGRTSKVSSTLACSRAICRMTQCLRGPVLARDRGGSGGPQVVLLVHYVYFQKMRPGTPGTLPSSTLQG